MRVGKEADLVRRAVRLNEALGDDNRQAFVADGRRVIALVAEVEALEPSLDLVWRYERERCPSI